MSDVCGIFYKSCPQCAMAVAKSATGCPCGYSFEDETPASAIAQSLAEEKLYEDYLLARVAQTAQSAIDAQAAQKRLPTDGALKATALAAMEIAEAARRDLAAQSARVEELRQALAVEATVTAAATFKGAATLEPESTPVQAAVKDPAPAVEAATPTSARAAEVARAAEALRSELAKLRHDNDRALTPARVLHPVRGEQRAASHSHEEKNRAENGAAGDIAHDAAGNSGRDPSMSSTRASENDAQARVAVTPANAAAKKRCPQCEAVVIAAANRCRCGFAFVAQAARPGAANVPKIEDVLARAQELKQARRESAQAQKAALIREARLARAAKKPTAQSLESSASSVISPAAARVAVEAVSPPADAVVPKDTPIRPVSACLAPARPLASAAARDLKECPNCTANVAAHASRCKCGFEFRDVVANSPMPALRLDDGDLLQVQDLYVRR